MVFTCVCFARIRLGGAARIRFPSSVNRFGSSFWVLDWCSWVCELCLHFGQEKRDLKLRAAAAGEPASLEEKDDWTDQVLSWLSDELAGPEAMKKKAPHIQHRLASQDTVLALDNALRHCTGQGLARFRDKASSDEHAGKDEKDIPGIRQPVLQLSIDQGPIGWCALFFMVHYLFLHVVPLPDPSHGIWNDTRNAIAACQWMPALVLGQFLCNMHFGPWLGEKWFTTLRDGVREVVAHADHTDALFQSLLPKILQDTDEGHLASSPGIDSKIWSELMDQPFWTTKGDMVHLSRWFDVLRVFRGFDRTWHRRCILARGRSLQCMLTVCFPGALVCALGWHVTAAP
jgi:hypothetical protein